MGGDIHARFQQFQGQCMYPIVLGWTLEIASGALVVYTGLL